MSAATPRTTLCVRASQRYPRALLLLLLAIAVAPGLTTLASGQTSAQPRPGVPGRGQGRPEDHGLGARGPLAPGRRLGGRNGPFPLIGDVRVAGLTPGAIEALLRDLLGKDYLVNPQVSVSVQEYRSQRVFVLGEVEKPGTYAMTGQTTLLDVLSQAGGTGQECGPPSGRRPLSRVRWPGGPRAPPGSLTLRANLKRLLDGEGGGEHRPAERGLGLRSQAHVVLRPGGGPAPRGPTRWTRRRRRSRR